MKKIFAFAALAVATFAGAAFAADAFSIAVSGGKGKANEKVTSVVKVTPKGDYHINAEFPHKITLTLPEGVSADDVKVKGIVENDHMLSFKVVTTSAAAGKKDISAQVRFAVCTDATCEPQTAGVTIPVEAK